MTETWILFVLLAVPNEASIHVGIYEEPSEADCYRREVIAQEAFTQNYGEAAVETHCVPASQVYMLGGEEKAPAK